MMVERFQLTRRNIVKTLLVQVSTIYKREIIEMVKACPMDMNGLSTREYLRIMHLGSNDYQIGMDWL
jgi:hypothetical protein